MRSQAHALVDRWQSLEDPSSHGRCCIAMRTARLRGRVVRNCGGLKGWESGATGGASQCFAPARFAPLRQTTQTAN